jgi:hypothetical protein
VIVGLGDIYAQIPRREEVRELMRATQASVREQAGCISYAFAETLDDPGHFIVVQQWRDQAAVDEIASLLVRTSELRLHVVQEGFRPVDSTAPGTGAED